MEPRWTGIWGALATRPPSGPNIAQEKSSRSCEERQNVTWINSKLSEGQSHELCTCYNPICWDVIKSSRDGTLLNSCVWDFYYMCIEYRNCTKVYKRNLKAMQKANCQRNIYKPSNQTLTYVTTQENTPWCLLKLTCVEELCGVKK